MEEKIVFRIERDNLNGMWYDADGSYNGFIHSLPDGKAASLPMDYDKDVCRKKLISGTVSLKQMSLWFSDADKAELGRQGFKMTKYRVKKMKRTNTQCFFRRDDVIGREEISMQGGKG